MTVISLTGDHLVPVGGHGAPVSVTVLSGDPVHYSTDRTYTIAGTIAVREGVDFEHSAWLWSPSLSEVRVEAVKPPTLDDVIAHVAEMEARGPTPGDELAKFLAPEPKAKWSWPWMSAVVVLGCGWLAGVLGAVGVLH